MKRDLRLTRKILEHFEAKNNWPHERSLIIEGYESDIIQYHLQILFEAGYLNAEPITTAKGRLYDLLPFRLTWQGHEFLDTIRQPKIWGKITQTLKNKGGELSFELIKQTAMKVLEEDFLKHLHS